VTAFARARLESILIPLGAIAVTLALFGAFVGVLGKNPLDVYFEMYRGAFGTWFSLQNTLLRASPLMLAALCTALPARLGLVVIGGEGAFVLGGLAAAAMGVAVDGAPPAVGIGAMMIAGIAAGGVWILLAGALRVYRGVNETISSLLLTYIAIALLNHFVEGPLRDPASLNKPSTRHIAEGSMLGPMPGMDVHWGLGFGLILCVLSYGLMYRTIFGFSAAVVGGNLRAARLAGLSIGRLTLITCFLAGGAAGLAGTIEVSAVHGAANASLVAGYGYAGILVAFLARQNPLAIIPVSLLLGGINASGGLLQRVFGLPDATVSVLQGTLFVIILASESLYGRFFLPVASDAEGGREVKLAVV
jgi:simple sugar transport system permease protein